MTKLPVKRPICRYHGGKWRLGKWIRQFFPDHQIYVEPFGGAGSVLLQKNRVRAEVFNDLDSRVVNLFRVLRDPVTAAELCRQMVLTPFARQELDDCYRDGNQSVLLSKTAHWSRDLSIEAARQFLVKAYMGHSSDSATRSAKVSFRCKRAAGRQLPSMDWAGWPDIVPAVVDRLQGVTIENRCGIELMSYYDGPSTLFYADPPYLLSTRSNMKGRKANGSSGYAHELSDDDHKHLAETLNALNGMVVLSGYDNALYRELLPDWQRHETVAFAERGRERQECVWLNPACVEALQHG